MVEREASEEHLVEEDTEAPHVAPLIVRQLFDDFVTVVARSASLPCSRLLVVWKRTVSSCKTEVGEAYFEFIIFDEDVLWLDVSMHH